MYLKCFNMWIFWISAMIVKGLNSSTSDSGISRRSPLLVLLGNYSQVTVTLTLTFGWPPNEFTKIPLPLSFCRRIVINVQFSLGYFYAVIFSRFFVLLHFPEILWYMLSFNQFYLRCYCFVYELSHPFSRFVNLLITWMRPLIEMYSTLLLGNVDHCCCLISVVFSCCMARSHFSIVYVKP